MIGKIKHHKVDTKGRSTYLVIAEDESGTIRAAAKLVVYLGKDTQGELSCLHVDKSHQGQGFGTALQDYRENIIKSLGGKEAILWADARAWPHRWYVSRGYEFDGSEPGLSDYFVKSI